jgi:hypothetical protein
MSDKITKVLAVIALVFGLVAIVVALSKSPKLESYAGMYNTNPSHNYGNFYAGGADQFSVLADGTITASTFSTDSATIKEATTVTGNTLTDTITVPESFTTFYAGASTTTYTLPAVASSAGVVLRFVIATAFATSNVIIDSAEGDNIEGALIVAGAVVDCNAVDQINFVNDGENLGDFVELRSNGTNWFIAASGALTASKLTCTDPS